MHSVVFLCKLLLSDRIKNDVARISELLESYHLLDKAVRRESSFRKINSRIENDQSDDPP